MNRPTVVRPSAFQSPARKIRLLLASLPMFAGLLSEDGTVLECNFAPLGGPLEERTSWIGRPIETGPWWSYSEESRAEILIMMDRARQGERVSKERLYRRPDGNMGVMMLSLIPLFAPYGQPDAILVVAVDVTERRRAHDTAAHIANDMSHRLRNSFTVMRTLATRATDDENPADVMSVLSRRLSHIRDSHTLSYRYLFFDVPLQDVVTAALGDNTHVSLDAFTPISVPSDLVEALMLAFGELAKPGRPAILNVKRGGDDQLILRWTEEKPREDADMPSGLPHILVGPSPAQKSGGSVHLDNDANGFVWTFSFPLQRTEEASNANVA